MITFTARSREAIVQCHTDIADAVEARDGTSAIEALKALEVETLALARNVFAAHAARR
jgi:DNA-binding GntR family transcriptional regulator